jgi:ATP-binding protein involved in chromosome partitioning
MLSASKILDAFRSVKHPDEKSNIVELGHIEDLIVKPERVSFTLVFRKPGDPFEKSMRAACERKLKELGMAEGTELNIGSRYLKKIQHAKEADQKAEMLPHVRNIIAVASGKGGVGKSTVAANLAVALAEGGARVALVDADIYGPSLPIMFDLVNEKPFATEVDGKTRIEPLERYGVQILSIGFFVDPSKALIWRGPMASSALTSLFRDAEWGEIDYMVIDMPPGTGDIHLTLVQNLPVTGAVIVSTPQEVALADARKGVAMFRQKDINVPVLGLVENMAWFTPLELPDNKYYIFGNGGVARLAEELNVPLLGQIPLVQGVRESGDNGMPAVLDKTSPVYPLFRDLANEVRTQLAIRHSIYAPTEVVKMNDSNDPACQS